MATRALLFIFLFAGSVYSQIGSYVFTNSVGTFALPPGTVFYSINGGGGTMDNGYSLPITIPFTFNFGGTNFTQYVMCSNGFMAFGTSLTVNEIQPFYNPWTGSRNNVICYNSRDMAPDAGTFFGYVTEGTAPNRIHRIICIGLRHFNGFGKGNCLISLYEGTNKIEILYSNYATTWTGVCMVGLRGSSSASTDMKTLLGTGPTAWTNPAAGSTNTATMNQQSPVNPDEGRMYTFFYDPTPIFYVSSTTTQTLTTTVYSGATNQQIIGLEVVMGGYINPLNLTGLTLNTNGSTNAANDIANAKVYFTGSTGTFSPTNLFGSVYSGPNGSFTINGSQALLNGTNYFWLAYDISPTGTTGNVVDAEFNQLTISGSGTHTPSVQAPAGNRQIIPAITSVNVGAGETYTSLTNTGGLFEAINTGAFPVAANITVNITSNLTETGTVALNDWLNSNSLNIVPSAAVERLISGSNSTTALITLSGADRVNIDGRFGGSGKYFRLRNTSGVKPTIQLINDSKRNTIRDCYIESNNGQPSPFSGGGTIYFSTTTGTAGNDSNTIMNCDIRNRSDAAGNPVFGIVNSGNATGVTNDNNTITGCNIYNFNASTTYGIYLQNGTGSNWVIQNNSFYNTSGIASTLWYAIFISSTTNGDHQISNNYIGGTAPNCGGTPLTGTLRTLNGIFIRALVSSSNTISGNVIKNINLTKTSNATFEDGLLGIYAVRSNYTINNNIMGDTVSNDNVTISGSASITHYGFFIKTDSVYNLTMNSNTAGSVTLNIGGTAVFTAMYSEESPVSSNTTKQVSNNKIGSFTVANSIKTNSPTASQLHVLTLNWGVFGTSLANVTGNKVVNLTNMPPNNSFDEIKGISGGLSYQNVNAVCSLTDNEVYNLTSGNLTGISFSMYDYDQAQSPMATGYFYVKNNTVKGLIGTGTSAGSNVLGIYFFGKADYNEVSNNKVSNLSNVEHGYMVGIGVRSTYWWPEPIGTIPFEKNLIFNNQISITNGESSRPGGKGETDSYTNSQYILGLVLDHGDSARVYNNTIYIGGIEGGTRFSQCIHQELYTGWNVKPDIRNNLLINKRTGTGDHSAIRVEVPDSSFSRGTFNYNTYIVSDTNKLCEWPAGNFRNFTQWKAVTQSDNQSWAVGVSEINPANLFIDAVNGNLNINYNNPEAWIVSGKGIPLSYVSKDYDGNPRPTSILYNHPTDIGADEFSQTPPGNPSAVEIGTPGAGNTTTYRLYGRNIMEINWGIGGTSYPTGMDVNYYSSVQPPGITGSYGYSYWNATPVGQLTGAAYDITLNFGDNETHSITSPSANTRLAKKDAEWVAYTTLGSGNLETELDWANLKAKVRGLDGFSDFALIDFSNPLPVSICSFSAIAHGRNVFLSWETCGEINNAGFDVERRDENPITHKYSEWNKITFIAGSGTTNEPKSYRYHDKRLTPGNYQYRLKQIDYNGSFVYYNLTNPEVVQVGRPGSFEMSQNYPNPSNPNSKIDYQIPFNGKVDLTVYDLLGREVKKLVNNEIREAGYYTSEFDGSALASGIYFYRIVAEGEGQKFIKTLKMVLIK